MDSAEESFEFITQYTDTASRINCLALNQNASQLACGTQLGFRVYSVPEFRLLCQREKQALPLQSSIVHIALLQESLIVALNPFGNNPKYHRDMVYIWDDKQQLIIRQVQMYYPLQSLHFYLDVLVLGSHENISVYRISDSRQTLDHRISGTSIYTISLHAHRLLLAYFSPERRLLLRDILFSRSLEVREKPSIQAEGCQLLRLSKNNEWVVKVSSSGRYVYVYEIETSALLFTLYRGYNNNSILDLSLSPHFDRLSLITTKGTLHVFRLDPSRQKGLMQMLSTDYVNSYAKRPVSLQVSTNSGILSN